VLLTADIEAPAEERLLASGADLRATVLKVGHHGSRTSTTPRFLAAVAPWAAVISVGAGNDYGHPAPETLARLAPRPTWRTDQSGTVEVVSDGVGVWVR
jgi:beta-lactamase superfamily II metal-dependent hydrolase